MRDAFVSYATRDSRDTWLMCAGLQALGITLWLDTEDLRRGRSTWREAVQSGIAASHHVLVALSSDWAASPACRYELAIALERRTPIIAVDLPWNGGAGDTRALLPSGAELIDGGGSVELAIERVGARLGHRTPR